MFSLPDILKISKNPAIPSNILKQVSDADLTELVLQARHINKKYVLIQIIAVVPQLFQKLRFTKNLIGLDRVVSISGQQLCQLLAGSVVIFNYRDPHKHTSY